jgi:hypothetical protein
MPSIPRLSTTCRGNFCDYPCPFLTVVQVLQMPDLNPVLNLLLELW